MLLFRRHILEFFISCIWACKRSISDDSLSGSNKMLKREESSFIQQPSEMFFKFMNALDEEDDGELLSLVYDGELVLDGYMPCMEASDKLTPLMMAAHKGHISACMILIEAGANPDLLSPNRKRSAMFYAELNGDEGLIEALKPYCKDVDAETDLDATVLDSTNADSETILDMPVFEPEYIDPETGLDITVLQPVLRILGVNQGSNDGLDVPVINTMEINKLLSAISPLPSFDHWSYLVTKALELDLSELVVDNIISTPCRGLDLDLYNHLNTITTFIKRIARESTFKKTIKNTIVLLKDLRSRRPTNLNAIDNAGRNPLILAIESDLPEVALKLIKYGATGYPRDRKSLSPLELIARRFMIVTDHSIWLVDHDHPQARSTLSFTQRLYYKTLERELIMLEPCSRYMELEAGQKDDDSIFSLLPEDIIKSQILPFLLALYRQEHRPITDKFLTKNL